MFPFAFTKINCTNTKKQIIYSGIQKYEHDQQQLLIEFDKNDEQDALIWYNVLLKYVDKDDASAIAFVDYQQYLPANPIAPLL